MPSEDREDIVLQLMRFFPKTIVDELVLDRGFRDRNQIRSAATIAFPGVAVAFPRNDVLTVVSRVFRPGSSPETVTDKAGGKWEVAWDAGDGHPVMKNADQKLSLIGLWFVATDDDTRRTMLDRMLKENRATGPDMDRWRETLTAGPIDFEDIERFHEDMEKTPTQNVISLRAGLEEGSSKPDTLVPRGLEYYGRLVGPAGDTETITAFAEGPAKAHVTALLKWDAEQGLRQALLSGSQSGLVPSIPDGFDSEILKRVIAWAARYGDRISQVAAFEMGLKHFGEHPGIVTDLVSIAEQIRDDDPDDPNGRLLLLSNLFTFVDGGIVHCGYLRDVPPFWRRLASLAQASMIEREFVAGQVSPANSTKWLKSGRGLPFYLQNSIDGRREPRWLPDFAGTHQWKKELVSRIVGSAERNAAAIEGTPLDVLIRSTGEGSLRQQFEFPFSYLPGPLEGGLDFMVDAPPEFQEAVSESVRVAATEPAAFNALVNTCLVFRTPPELAQQAAEGIKAAKYRVRENLDSGQNFAMLSGLATVAAVTRSHDLAREVRVLTRIALRRVSRDLNVIQLFRIGIIAANAFADLYEWREFLGEWVTELAFSDLNREDAYQLHGFVETLCALEPALWATLSRAEAALVSYINAVRTA